MNSYTHEVHVGDTLVAVTFNWAAGIKGRRYGMERFVEPDDPDEFEVTGVDIIGGDVAGLLQDIQDLQHKHFMQQYKNGRVTGMLTVDEILEQAVYDSGWQPE